MLYNIIGKTMTATIDSCGARLSSIKKNEIEYIWQRDPDFWSDCAPILFPVIAEVRNGIITVDGVDYPITKHGLLRNVEFDMIKQTKSMITFKSVDNEETLKSFPWSFEFYISFCIENDDKLSVTFEVINTTAEKPMCFCLGGHPAINIPLDENEQFEDYVIEFEKSETLYSNYTNSDGSTSISRKDLILDQSRILPIRRSLFNNDALIFESIKSNSLELKNLKTEKGIRFEFGDFPTLAIWSKGEPIDAKFICIEPWFGMGYRENEGTDLEKKYQVQTINPGEEFTASFGITIL